VSEPVGDPVPETVCDARMEKEPVSVVDSVPEGDTVVEEVTVVEEDPVDVDELVAVFDCCVKVLVRVGLEETVVVTDIVFVTVAEVVIEREGELDADFEFVKDDDTVVEGEPDLLAVWLRSNVGVIVEEREGSDVGVLEPFALADSLVEALKVRVFVALAVELFVPLLETVPVTLTVVLLVLLLEAVFETLTVELVVPLVVPVPLDVAERVFVMVAVAVELVVALPVVVEITDLVEVSDGTAFETVGEIEAVGLIVIVTVADVDLEPVADEVDDEVLELVDDVVDEPVLDEVDDVDAVAVSELKRETVPSAECEGDSDGEPETLVNDECDAVDDDVPLDVELVVELRVLVKVFVDEGVEVELIVAVPNPETVSLDLGLRELLTDDDTVADVERELERVGVALGLRLPVDEVDVDEDLLAVPVAVTDPDAVLDVEGEGERVAVGEARSWHFVRFMRTSWCVGFCRAIISEPRVELAASKKCDACAVTLGQ
jgi:hypothetical protein